MAAISDKGPAKPVHNLALRVFQRYYHELCTALSSCPEEVAAILYSNELVTRQERSRAVDTLGLSPFRKGEILVQAVERRTVVENSSASLRKFCQVLRRRHDMGSIVLRMKLRLAYVEKHHQLPDDEWSSDTECEQEPSSPAKKDPPQVENLPEAVKRHSCYLKELYKEREGMHLKWPPVLMKEFVNVLCIKSTNELDEELTEQLVHGHVDKLKKTRTPIELSDIASMKDGSRPKCILVQGAPGCGKTMFSWEMCQKWGKGELFQQYSLVVMLPLRDPDIQNAESVEDLFPHDNQSFSQEVAAVVKQEAGKGVLFLLDGFDELPDVKRKESLWMKLITGKLLPLSTVMVTSRTWAIKTLLELKYNPRISQHIEIVGFTKNNIHEYISKAFTDSRKERSFCEYLARYPHIRSTMYVPLNCAIVVEVYRSSGSKNPAPKTMTQLYIALVKAVLQRYMDSHPEGPRLNVIGYVHSVFHSLNKVHCFRDLPSNVYQQLYIISKIAYQGLRNNQQLIFSKLPANFETLGLLQEVPQLYRKGKTSSSYNFLHLTVQEFLAALHIVQQGTKKQAKVLKGEVVFKCPTVEKGEVVLPESDTDTHSIFDRTNGNGSEEIESERGFVCMFLAGLSGLKQCELLVPTNFLKENTAFLHLLFESQNEILVTSILGNESTLRIITSDHVSPHDAYVLGFCVSLSRCQWALELRNIGDEDIDLMKRAIAGWGCSKGRIIRVYFHHGRLSSDGVRVLLSLPHDTLRSLKVIDLTANKLDSKSCDMLAHWLSSPSHLEQLYLTSNEIGFEGAQLLSQPLYTNTTLRQLGLSSNRIENRGTCSLAKVLSVNTCLETLFIGENQIDCEGAHLLSQSLHCNSTLSYLYVGWNEISDRGGCSLAEALTINKVLVELNLIGNPLGEKSIQELIDSLQHNHTLQKMWLSRHWRQFSEHCSSYNEVKGRIYFY